MTKPGSFHWKCRATDIETNRDSSFGLRYRPKDIDLVYFIGNAKQLIVNSFNWKCKASDIDLVHVKYRYLVHFRFISLTMQRKEHKPTSFKKYKAKSYIQWANLDFGQNDQKQSYPRPYIPTIHSRTRSLTVASLIKYWATTCIILTLVTTNSLCTVVLE